MKKTVGIITAVIIVVVCALVILMLTRDSKAASFTVADGKLEIKCSFGVTVPLSETTDLKLADAWPSIVTKTNGSGVGTVYKGEFLLINDVKARLYADAKNPPFISFTQGDTVFYLSAETPEETKTLFEQLKSAAGG